VSATKKEEVDDQIRQGQLGLTVVKVEKVVSGIKLGEGKGEQRLQ